MTFAANNIPLVKLNPVKTTLEDIFIELTSEDTDEELYEQVEGIAPAIEKEIPEQEAR